MQFINSFFQINKLPNDNITEICLIGRSNVGKSSLINMLSKSKIAKTSKTPGATRCINLFSMNKIRIVDLPGYGYSKTPRSISDTWNDLLYTYITKRKNLKNRIILIDGKIGFKKNDLEILDLLSNYTYEIFFTKSEKISKTKQQELIDFCKKNHIKINANNFCSSKTGLGHKNILQFINQYNI
ncbi:MAG: ribosome biogenesis GTP-binding protein YihA/YsxC [Pseudomonadota bacterium]